MNRFLLFTVAHQDHGDLGADGGCSGGQGCGCGALDQAGGNCPVHGVYCVVADGRGVGISFQRVTFACNVSGRILRKSLNHVVARCSTTVGQGYDPAGQLRNVGFLHKKLGSASAGPSLS